MLVRILHVVQAEIQAIHQGLLVESTIGRKNVKGIAVREVGQAQGTVPRKHPTRAALALQAGEHKLLGVGGQGGGLGLLGLGWSAQAEAVE